MGAGASTSTSLGDGPFTKEELQAAFGDEFAEEAFETAKGEDGKVTKEALQSFIEANAPAKKAFVPESNPSATEVLRVIHSKEKSCVEVITACFDRIEETKELNCVVEALKDAALQQAKAVDDKIAKGEALRSLEGLPIVVKNNIHGPPGTLCTAGTMALAEHRPKDVAPCMQPLLDQGAIAIAKVHMLEMATGVNGTSTLHGRCLNPYNKAFNCGGSSSGTGVSIAAGIASCGLGTDTGGSCRLPAALNGICGLRPSTKRLSVEGIIPCSTVMDTPGPLGTCVGDLCLLDSVMTKTDLVTKTELSGLKFAIPKDWVASKSKTGLSDTVQKSVDVAKAAMEAAGAEVVELDFLPVVEATKDQWINPMVPFVFDNSHEDLTNYLNGFGEDERPAATVEDVLAKIPINGIVQKFTKPALEGEEYAKKVADREESRVKLEAVYRAFFKDNGVSAVVLPCFPQEITKIGIEKEGLSEFMNEFCFTLHMNEIAVPSMVMPVKSVKHPESGVPCSLLLYGTEDRELLGHALGVEAAIATKEAR